MSDSVYSRKAVLWIAGLSVLSFVLALVLTAFADDLGQPSSAASDSYSLSAIGHHGAKAFLESSGIAVRVRRSERSDNIDPAVPVLAAEPRTALGAGDPVDAEESQSPRFDRLLEAVRSREAPLIVVMPKWVGMPNPSEPRWIAAADPIAAELHEILLDRLEQAIGARLEEIHTVRSRSVECDTEWGTRYTLSLRRPTFLKPTDAFEGLVRCDEGWLAASHLGEDGLQTVVVSDPGILNNHGLGRGDNAALLADLLRLGLGSDAVLIDETIHGFARNTGLIAELFRFPLVLAVAHGALLVGWLVWFGSRRFGAPRPSDPATGSGKQVLIDNTAKLLGVVGQTGETLPRYFNQVSREVGSHYFLAPNLPEEERLLRLTEIGKSRKINIDLKTMSRAIERLRSGGREQTVGALALAKRLHRWREEMTRVD